MRQKQASWLLRYGSGGDGATGGVGLAAQDLFSCAASGERYIRPFCRRHAATGRWQRRRRDPTTMTTATAEAGNGRTGGGRRQRTRLLLCSAGGIRRTDRRGGSHAEPARRPRRHFAAGVREPATSAGAGSQRNEYPVAMLRAGDERSGLGQQLVEPNFAPSPPA